MDSRTAFIAISLMMLANGSVLALVSRDLPTDLQPSARSWQAGTLAIAVGCSIFALQSRLPLVVMVAAGNGLILTGLTLYWRSLQQLRDLASPPWQPLPAIAGTLGLVWFSTLQPDTGIRIVIASAVWLFLMGGCVAALWGGADRDSRSRRVLMALFCGVMAFAAFRLAFYLQLGLRKDFSIADNASWMNQVTPMAMAVLPVIGTTAFLLMCSEHLRRQWERAASTDHLTGLANRRTLMEAGHRRFGLALSRKESLALAILDIDSFKSINDRHGHEVGDLALKHVAASLEAGAEPSEVLARTGGEEFVVLLGGLSPRAAREAAERLRQAVQRHPFESRAVRMPLTVSVGVAVSAEGDEDFESLLRRADQAMYLAKSAGRNRVELAA